MIQRFRRPFTALAAPTSKNCADAPECPCCAAIRRARERALFDPLPEWNSPLSAGVQLVNLSHSADGRNLRADLGADWARMFGHLPLVGRGLVMTRNAAAILGRQMPYPALSVTSGGGKGASGEGGLWLDFARLGAARAIHVRRETGHVFGAEFCDEEGNIAHRFTLMPESDLDEFLAWVRLHQACTAHAPAAWIEEGDEAAPEPARAVRNCDVGALASIVAACVDRAVPLRATVRTAAVTQRAEFIPRSLQPSEDWWFASDDTTGLHFAPELFTRVTLEVPSRDEGGAGCIVHASGEEPGAALVLESGCPAAEAAWSTLLEATA